MVSGVQFISPSPMLNIRYVVEKLDPTGGAPLLNNCGEKSPGDPVANPNVMPKLAPVEVKSPGAEFPDDVYFNLIAALNSSDG